MSRNSSKALLAAAGALGLALAAPAAPAAADPPAVYAGLVYDILLLRQCGLADARVETGFRLAVHDLIGAGDMTPAAFAAARAAGAARYEVEIRDRGSGPADPRCRREAVVAAGRFRAVIDAE
jgi:hypothetical protein